MNAQEIILAIVRDAPWPAAAVLVAVVAGIVASRLSSGVTRRQRLRTRQAEAETEKGRLAYLSRSTAIVDSGGGGGS